MTDYSYANRGPEHKAAAAEYYRTHKDKWANVNRDDATDYLAPPKPSADDRRVQQYRDWFSGPQDKPAPVFFSAEYVQQLADLHRQKMERVAASSEVRNALYLNSLKYYTERDEDMPGAEKKWFNKTV